MCLLCCVVCVVVVVVCVWCVCVCLCVLRVEKHVEKPVCGFKNASVCERDRKGLASDELCVWIEPTLVTPTAGDDVAMHMLNHTHRRQPAHWNDGHCQPESCQRQRVEVRFRHDSADRCSSALPRLRPAWRPESAWIKACTCATRPVARRRNENIPECHQTTEEQSHRFLVQCEAIRLPLASARCRL